MAAWENDTTVELTTKEVQNRLYTSLYHADLPKLDEYGLITFDAETGKVTATDHLEQITPYLELAQTIEPDDYEQFCTLLAWGSSNDRNQV